MHNKKILILGIGNTLLCDEGFGVRAVQYLHDHYQWPDNVTLVDGGTRGLLLMSELMECDYAVILDIMHGGKSPGTIYYFSGNDMAKTLQTRQSAHQTSLNDILISCELAGHRPETAIFALEPFDCESVSVELSRDAANLLPEFCSKVVKELRALGLKEIKEI